MLVDELLAYLFDGQPHLLAESMAAWLASSRRFTAFIATFRDKVRKKLRTIQDQETLQDLRLELETAYLLLQEQSLSLVYEPKCGQGRCPDFAVDFTTSLTFMVEVTRQRAGQAKNVSQASGQPRMNHAISPSGEALIDTICSKLGQFVPQRSNVLVVGLDALQLSQHDLRVVMLRIQQLAERADLTFWGRYRFQDRTDFFQHYQRLSEILIRESQPGETAVAWKNPQAKYPLPGRVRTSLYRSHGIIT